MKKLFAILIVILAPVLLPAQDSPLSALYAKYNGEKGFQSTEILPGSTSYDWEKNIDAHIMDMIRDIKAVRILEYEGDGSYSTEKIWKKLTGAADDKVYTEIASVNAEEMKARLYIMKGPDGSCNEIALIAGANDGVALITISGTIDLSKVMSPETIKSLMEVSKTCMKDKGQCEVR
jgi:hypothetical protein